jgi:hypothetical protein
MAMAGRRQRDKIVAEISLVHLIQFANEIGRALSPEEAMVFLNEEERAYEMWKRMMGAGEDYIKLALCSNPRPPVTHPTRAA